MSSFSGPTCASDHIRCDAHVRSSLPRAHQARPQATKAPLSSQLTGCAGDNSPYGVTAQGAVTPSGAQLTPDKAVYADELESLAEMYDRHSTRVFSVAMRIVHEVGAAEDVVQEVFLQAWTQRRGYNPAHGSVGAWLLMLTRSRSIDRLRAIRRDGGQSVSCDCASLPAPAVPDTEGIRTIREALVVLPHEDRHPFELAFYEGYTHSEISGMLKQPLGTVKTRIRRAMLTLRTAIESPGREL